MIAANNKTKINNRNDSTTQPSQKTSKTPSRTLTRNKRWLNSVGQLQTTNFKVAPRPYQVYLGRIDNSMNEKDVTELLNKLEIKFFNLKQINTVHNNFKSFCFSIDYLDREIIKNKEIWPRGLVVNRLINKKSTASTSSQATNENTHTNV